jgi:hypothetical protein
MSGYDEDDKPTVVLDLNALKKQKLDEEENLANIAGELEFNVEARKNLDRTQQEIPANKMLRTETKNKFSVVLFDINDDFLKSHQEYFPDGFDYKFCSSLNELNQVLKNDIFQIVVFLYDQNPKAINQLSAQIRQKLKKTKVLIMAKSISEEKAKIHARTPAGASAYYQLPLDPEKLSGTFEQIFKTHHKAS